MIYIKYDIYTYIYIHIYSFPIMVAHATIYITVIEVSCMHLLLCAIYQTQKGVWLVNVF